MIKAHLATFALFMTSLSAIAADDRCSNQTTIAAYELSIQEYIAKTTPEYCAGFNAWIDASLSLLPLDAHILEIGSAFGRDAQYIESKGFSVERTDATKGFVSLLQEKGYYARLFNVLTEDFSAVYDLVFANRVFLHFTPFELESVLNKIKASLTDKGILAFSLKKGEGEEWSEEKLGNPRYYCYWSRDKIQSLLELSGFEVISIAEDDKFLQVIARYSMA
ncbi:MAG: methyltransferase domain-containing protein [Rhabdochlamydiaceae bacterium]|nr:methyltransferase domain-containing protein [Rhabdochlamydiaceae bacterium]